jgi:hypothetical protein
VTVNITLSSGAVDGGLRSSDSGLWSNACAGSVFIGGSGGASSGWGGWYTGGIWNAYETFLSFTYTPPSGEHVVSAALRLTCTETYTPSVDRVLQVFEFDFGAGVTSADWRNPTWFTTALHLAECSSAQNATAGQWIECGSDTLVTRMADASPLQVVVTSDHVVSAGPSPTGNEFSAFALGGASGTADDPALVWTTMPVHHHEHVSGAQVRLSDGSWAYLAGDGADPPAVSLLWRDAVGSTATIGSIPIGSSSTDYLALPGLQSFALVTDASDNLYVAGCRGDGLGALMAVTPYRKGAGTTWTKLTMRTWSTPAYDRCGVNTVAAAWHDAGTSGTIMCVTARGHGDWPQYPANDIGYALLSCAYLLGGAGPLVHESGSGINVVVDGAADSRRYARPACEVGTGLDVMALDGVRGVVAGFDGSGYPGEMLSTYPWLYRLTSAGTGLSYTSRTPHPVYPDKTSTSKVRAVRLSTSTFAVVAMVNATGWGATVTVYTNNGTSTTSFTALVVLDPNGPSSMPSAATLAVSSTWDAVYDPTDGKLWIYYVDAADARTVHRTSISTATWLAAGDEAFSTQFGTAGAVIRHVRVERNNRQGDDSCLVSVALDTSGVLSTEYEVDSFNLAPTTPTLTPKVNFDATAEAVFAWTFNDPNTSDSQSAYQIDVNLADGSDVYDSGELDGTITYVAAGTSQTGDNESLTPPLPTGWEPGDLLLVMASIRNSGTGTVDTPSGWTVLVDLDNFVLLGRHAMDGDTAPEITYTGGASGATVLAKSFAFRGVYQDFASVVHVVETQTNGSAQDVATPAATVTEDGCMVVWIGWKQDDLTAGSSLGPTQSDVAVFTYSTQGDDAASMLAYALQTTATNITTDLFDVDGGAAAISKSAVLALLPAPDPTSETFTLPAGICDNEESYQWRVRTWDAAGLVSPWASYGTFATSASGTVTVTDPATDNTEGIVSDTVRVSWSVADTTQVDYQVVVTRTDTSEVLVDTGWVTSVDEFYTVSGMLSRVEYSVAVTVRNGAEVESGAGTRLITPDYSAPETPTIVVTGYPTAGYILVDVTNPEPGTPDLGTSPWSFEDGVDEFTATDCTFAQSVAVTPTDGTYTGKMTVTGTPATATVITDTDNCVAVTSGSRYRVSCQAYSVAGYADVRDTIVWYDSGMLVLSTSTGTAAVPADAWTARSYATEAPSGAAYAGYGITIADSPSTDETLYIDELLFAVDSDRPSVASVEIHRRVSGDTLVTAVASDDAGTTIDANGQYRDYTAASDVSYEYRARALTATGYADSEWATATSIALVGVWIHDPLDPAGTAWNFPYGRSGRSSAIAVPSAARMYAGRTWPVVDFGTARNDTFSVRAEVPHGTTWAADVAALQAFAAMTRTLWIRDNRGRSLACTLSGYGETDANWGTEVGFEAARVHQPDATVTT